MIKDNEVKQNIEHELGWDAAITATGLDVSVKAGVATLSGVVHRYSEKVAAERAAKRVKGVYGVANDIEVRLGSDARSDGEIARDAVASLRLQLPASSETIQVIVEDGHLRLEGQVQWHYQRQRAESAVRNVRGIKGVSNRIALAHGPAEREVRGAIQAAFHRNAQIEANRITIEATEGQVVLSGSVRNWAERDEAERAAWMAPGVSSVRNEIRIAA